MRNEGSRCPQTNGGPISWIFPTLVTHNKKKGSFPNLMKGVQMKNIGYVLILVAVLLLSGCATIFTGTTDPVTIESTPNASFVVRNAYGAIVAEGTTPTTVELKRKTHYTIEISLDGYKSKTMAISQDFNMISILNLGSVFGWAVDYLTGAIFKLYPQSVRVTLEIAVLDSGVNPVACVKLYDGNNVIATNSAELVPVSE